MASRVSWIECTTQFNSFLVNIWSTHLSTSKDHYIYNLFQVKFVVEPKPNSVLIESSTQQFT